VPTVGAAVRLAMAGSWTDSGHEVGGPQPRPVDTAAHLCEPLADPVRGLVRGTPEAWAAALLAPGAGQLRVAGEARAENGHGLVSGTNLDPHRARGTHDVRSMEGVVAGQKLALRRAARRADLVPTVGKAVRLVMAGSWTGSGNELGERHARREDETAHLCRRPARREASLIPGNLEARTTAVRGPCEGRLRVAREARTEDGHGPVSGLNLDTHRDRRPAPSRRGKVTRRSRFLAGRVAVVSREVGHSRTRARPRIGVEPGRKHDATWAHAGLAPRHAL